MTWYMKAILSAIGIGVIAYLVKINLYGTNPILFGVICLAIVGLAWFIWDR